MKTLQRAFRTLLHYKQYSIINIVGLALSLTCVIVIFRYAHGELTVDRFNRNIDRIFVTTTEMEAFVGVNIAGMNMAQLADVANVTQHPGVERVSNVSRRREAVVVNEREFNAIIVAADTNFLKIMEFPVVAGIADFANPGSAMVTRAFAQRTFGTRYPIGQTFRSANDELMTVTGIIGETSTKSSYTFDVLVSREALAFRGGRGDTFVLLYRGVDFRAVNRMYEAFVPLGVGGMGGQQRGGFGRTNIRFQLFPLKDIYFSDIPGPAFQRGNRQSVNILLFIGLMILLVGVVNYINIHTVVMMRKGKQLAVKKIFGAGSWGVFAQMLVDNALMIGIALVLGFIAVIVTSPFVTNDLHLGQVPDLGFDIMLSIGILVFLSIITTLYPFYRYRFNTPIHSLRGLDKIRGGRMRNVFLTIQYFMTIAMIIVSMFFVRQVHFMLNYDVGFRTENVITLHNFMRWQGGGLAGAWQQARGGGGAGGADRRAAEEIGQRLDASPLFLYWTPGEAPQAMGEIELSYQDGEPREVRFMSGREDWFNVFDIRLVEGRMWDDQLDAGQPVILVTESFLPYFGITDWREASITPDLGMGLSAFIPSLRIIGVVRDFTHTHLSEPSLPVVFGNLGAGGRGGGNSISAAVVPGRMPDAVAFLRELHQDVVGGEFRYTFVDDQIRAMYAEERIIAIIFSIITLIAIIVSALGLYGMSLFDVQQRRREIAIRKVHGATIVDVIRLLMRKYLIALAIAFVFAAPVAVLAINIHLENYAHRASVAWWLFVGALIVTAAISFFTLLYQTYKAANENPAHVVKSE